MNVLKVKSNGNWIDIPAIKGDPGDDYVLTSADKAEIAQLTAAEVTVPVQDVQVNGTSVLSSGVANVPIAVEGGSNGGVVRISSVGYYGINQLTTGSDRGYIRISKADSTSTKAGSAIYAPIVPANQHEAAFYGLAKAAGDSTQSESSNAVGTYTAAAKTAIRNMLGVTDGSIYTETVSGTTPSITGEPNVRYICGEISTLTITPPSAGSIIVRFRSGTSATVLTAQGVNWPGWFDPTSLETSTTYEIMITDGTYGSVMIWPV